MYEGAETTAATAAGETRPFPVRVRVHQGSVLSPLLFILAIDLIADVAGGELPWELFFADDLAILSQSAEEVERRAQRWEKAFRGAGLRVNIGKRENTW